MLLVLLLSIQTPLLQSQSILAFFLLHGQPVLLHLEPSFILALHVFILLLLHQQFFLLQSTTVRMLGLQVLQYLVGAGWLPLCWRFYRFYPLTQCQADVFSSLSSQLLLLLCCLGPPLNGGIVIGVDVAKLLEQLAFLSNLFICSRPVHRLFQCSRVKHSCVNRPANKSTYLPSPSITSQH